MTHDLKTLPAYWEAVERGDKTFEVRRDDRGFQKGDHVRLLKLSRTYVVESGLDGKPRYILERRIRYVLTGGQFGIEPGYVVLQLEPVEAGAQ